MYGRMGTQIRFRATAAGLLGGLKIKIERKKGNAMVKHNFHLDLAGWRMDWMGGERKDTCGYGGLINRGPCAGIHTTLRNHPSSQNTPCPPQNALKLRRIASGRPE